MLVLPFLLAAAPVLFLYGVNSGEVTAGSVWLPLLVSLAFAGIVLGIFYLITRDKGKATLMTSFVLVVFFSYGYFVESVNKLMHIIQHYDPIENANPQLVATSRTMDVAWLGLYVLILVLGLLILRKVTANKERTAAINKFLVVVAAAFLVISLGQVAYHAMSGKKGAVKQTAEVNQGSKAVTQAATSERPNIYYIILDGYSGQKVLSGFNYDNSAFLQQLQKDGFTIPADAKSNYTSTYPSLASSLNMQYVGKTKALPSNLELQKMIEYNEVMKFLRSKGYEIVHIGAPYPATSINRYADISYSGLSGYRDEFSSAFIRTTMARGLVPGNSWFISKEKVLQPFSVIPTLATSLSKPFFVFAHVISPHPPYLFDANGKAINPDVKNVHQAYLDQLTYVNKRVETLIHDILTKNKVPPIIIFQGDHSILYTNNILNAYYLPNGGSSALWSGITPVNTFRMIFDRYFGAHYKPLVDQAP